MVFFIGIKAYAATPTSYSTTNWSEVTKTQNTSPKNIWELKNVDIVHYTGNQTISSNFTIPAGKTLLITGNVSLTGITLKVYGSLCIEGNLTFNSNSSNLYIYDDGVVFVKKDFSAPNGGKVASQGSSTYGTFMVLGTYTSGTVKVTFSNNGNAPSNAVYIEKITGGTITANKINSSNKNGTAYRNGMNLFSTLGLLGLLPIELTSFTVSATKYGYTFNWVTASEVENDYFTLEYSIDGVDFNEIDYVHGAGTTSKTSEYEYRWDEAPEFDVVYFRLKQTDYNGEYSYSDVIVASRKKTSGANGTFHYGPLNLQIQDGELRYIVK